MVLLPQATLNWLTVEALFCCQFSIEFNTVGSKEVDCSDLVVIQFILIIISWQFKFSTTKCVLSPMYCMCYKLEITCTDFVSGLKQRSIRCNPNKLCYLTLIVPSISLQLEKIGDSHRYSKNLFLPSALPFN